MSDGPPPTAEAPGPAGAEERPPVTPAHSGRVPSRPAAMLAAAVAVGCIATNQRAVISAVGPLAGEIRAALGTGRAAVSLLTVIPTICFSVFALAAVPFGRWLGNMRALAVALALLLAGAAGRVLGGLPVLLVGTAMCGAGIAVCNVLVPAMLKSRYAARMGLMMGVYSVFLGLGGAVPPAFSVPLSQTLGGWRGSLAFWALPVLPALGSLAVLARSNRRRGPVEAGPDVAPPPVSGSAGAGAAASPVSTSADGAVTETAGRRWLLADPVALACTVFISLQSLGYYTLLAWLPTVIRDAGGTASLGGVVVTVGQVAAVPMSFLVPWHAARSARQSVHAAVLVVLLLAAIVGFLVAPLAAPFVWSVIWGVSGTTFPLALTMINLRSPDGQTAARLSGTAQTVGYAVASTGPLAVGVLREITGGWTLPLAGLGLATIPMLIGGVMAGRPRLVGGGRSGAGSGPGAG